MAVHELCRVVGDHRPHLVLVEIKEPKDDTYPEWKVRHYPPEYDKELCDGLILPD